MRISDHYSEDEDHLTERIFAQLDSAENTLVTLASDSGKILYEEYKEGFKERFNSLEDNLNEFMFDMQQTRRSRDINRKNLTKFYQPIYEFINKDIK